MKQRRMNPMERGHVWMGHAVKKEVLLILNVISIAKVTSRGERKKTT